MSLTVAALIDLMPALALVILLANARAGLPYTGANRMFLLVIGLNVAALAFDFADELLAGSSAQIAGIAQWAINVGYYLCLGSTAFCWFLYVRSFVQGDALLLPRGWRRYLAILPFIAYSLFVIATPWTHMVFTISTEARYLRGDLFPICFAFGLGYVIAASVLALQARNRASGHDARWCYTAFALFPAPVMCALAVGWAFDDFTIVLQGIAASIVLVYFDLQRGQITRDGLTGLNNRRRFDSFLEEKCSEGMERRSWALVIIDVDRFKAINDSLGHVGGDQILKLVAESLRRVFGGMNAFIARYGGDEFAVILDDSDENEIESLVGMLDDELVAMAGSAEWAPVTVSCGYAPFAADESISPNMAIAQADRSMYAVKQAKRRKRVDVREAGS